MTGGHRVESFILYSYFMPVCSIVKTITPLKKLLVSSGRVHNNGELPVGIFNMGEYLVWLRHRCLARCGVDICD